MNSTRLLRRFFRRSIVPTADKLTHRNRQFFQRSPDSESSWAEPIPSESAFLECSPELLQERLEQMWDKQGLSELEILAKPLVHLAEEIHKQYKGKSKTLSDTVYVMY